ncbi:hypothetical protein M8J76_010542 [Diaphorina citri]|nr:hypothetical protein M8J76_010542 [Diaphorina citri]
MRCTSLDERHFVCHPSLQVTQVRWHPHAPGDDLLLVLTSANDLRLYCGRSGRSASQRIDTAPPPAATLTSLGHVTVDFQFLPPRCKGEEGQDELEFPILVLFQDGEVHMINMVVRHNMLIFSPQNAGSLPILPYSSDNYAEDSSSLLVLPCTPPLVCIATSTGTLYHCETWHGVGSVSQAPYRLHVTEVVELKLGGLSSDEEGARIYFCFHKSGVHIVKLPLVDQLIALADADEDDFESFLPQFSSTRCHTEHLLYIGTTEETPSHLGFTLCHLPRALILLLGNGEFVSATLYSKGSEVHTSGLEEELSDKLNITGTRKTENYASYVANLLDVCDNIPLLKIDHNASFTDEEIKEIYSKNMELLMQQILPQLDLASQNMIEK